MILSTLTTLLVLSGTTYTNITGRYEARNAAGVMLSAHDTLEQCIAVLPLPTAPGKVRLGTCKLVYHIDGELNCNDAQRPPLATFTVIDENATVYRGPYCAPGETCTTPPDWNSSSTTYTDVGGVRMNADDTVDEYRLVLSPPPACWAWQWVRQAEPPVSAMPADARETWLTSDVTPVEVDEMDGNGLGVTDPPWGGM